MNLNSQENKNYLSLKIVHVSFLMSILVIYVHANNLAYYALGENEKGLASVVINFFSGTVGKVAVPMFFMISGYLFYYNIDVKSPDCINKIIKKLRRRIKTIVLPYLIWNTFGTIFYMLVPRIPLIGDMMSGEAVKFSLNNLMKGIFFYAYYFPLWYLGYLIVILTLTPIWSLILRKKELIRALLLLLGVWHVSGKSFPIVSASSVFFFLLGAYCVIYKRTFFECRFGMLMSVILGAVFICLSFIQQGNNNEIVLEVLYLASPLILWHAFDIIPCQQRIFQFERQSFFIYCSHVIIVTTIGKVMLNIGGSKASASWVLSCYFITPIITLLLLYLAYHILNSYIPRLYNVICGGRG